MKLSAIDPTLASRPDLGSGVSNRAKSLVSVSLSDLTPGDIAFCVRQSIALKAVIPLALELAAAQPLLETESYAGDLLVSLLEAAKSNRLSSDDLAELRDICSAALAAAETIAAAVTPEVKQFISQFDGT
jgi:hypothetical protein